MHVTIVLLVFCWCRGYGRLLFAPLCRVAFRSGALYTQSWVRIRTDIAIHSHTHTVCLPAWLCMQCSQACYLLLPVVCEFGSGSSLPCQRSQRPLVELAV